MAVSESVLGMGVALASGAQPVLTEMNPPAEMIFL